MKAIIIVGTILTAFLTGIYSSNCKAENAPANPLPYCDEISKQEGVCK